MKDALLYLLQILKYCFAPKKAHHTQGFENGVWQRDAKREIERVGRENINQTIESETIPHPTPKTFVLGVKFICGPNAKRHLNGKGYDGDDVDDLKHPFATWRDIEGGEENRQSTNDN